MVGRYFSVTLGKDLYGQSEDESCLGMLQVKDGKPQVDGAVIHSRKLQVYARRNLVSSKRS